MIESHCIIYVSVYDCIEKIFGGCFLNNYDCDVGKVAHFFMAGMIFERCSIEEGVRRLGFGGMEEVKYFLLNSEEESYDCT